MRCERSGRGEELEDHAYRRQCTAQIAGSQPRPGASKTEKGSERRSFDVRAAAPEELCDAAAALRWRRRKRGRELLRQLPKEATGLLVDLVSGRPAAPDAAIAIGLSAPCRPARPAGRVSGDRAGSIGTAGRRHRADPARRRAGWLSIFLETAAAAGPSPPAPAVRVANPLIEFLRSVELGYCARLHVEQRRRPSEGGIGSARRAARGSLWHAIRRVRIAAQAGRPPSGSDDLEACPPALRPRPRPPESDLRVIRACSLRHGVPN
eukprot:tig00000912_g5454.t1